MATARRLIAGVIFAITSVGWGQNPEAFDIHSDFFPTLRDARIDGTLFVNVPICSVTSEDVGSIWPVTLKHTLLQDGARTRSHVTLRGFRTSLAPYGKTQYVWSGPSGQDLPLDVLRQRQSGADCRVLAWTMENNAILVTDGGWRLYYEDGYLKRAVTSKGQTLRFHGRGPVIETITSGSLYDETRLLTFVYGDPVTPTSVQCNKTEIAVSYHGNSINAIKSNDSSVDITVGYREGLISAIRIGGAPNAIVWGQVPPTDFPLRNLNPYGVVLKQVNHVKYDVKATQAGVTVIAQVGATLERMIGNHYSRSIRYEVENR